MTEHSDKALRAADDLLDEYPAACDTIDGARNLLAIAWLKGSLVGSDETIEALRKSFAPTPLHAA